jgi:hypothetical protein
MNINSLLLSMGLLAGPALIAQAQTPPIAHWSFDKIENNTFRGVGKGAIPGAIIGPAVVAGNVAATPKGWKGGAVSFIEKPPGLITVPMDLSLLAAKGFTVEFWLRPTGITSLYGTCVDAGGSRGFSIRLNNKNCLSLSIGGNWNTITTTERYTDPTWVHVALTSDTKIARFYVGGVEVGTTPDFDIGKVAPAFQLGAVQERIKSADGSSTLETVKPLMGDLDELKVYAGALSAAEIAKAAAAKPSP